MFSKNYWVRTNLFIYQARQSPAWSQQGVWKPSFWRKPNLRSLFWLGEFGSAFIQCIPEGKGKYNEAKSIFKKMNLFPLFFFSIVTMQRNFTLVLPSKQSLHTFCFLKKLGCQKPCWDQTRHCLAWYIIILGSDWLCVGLIYLNLQKYLIYIHSTLRSWLH